MGSSYGEELKIKTEPVDVDCEFPANVDFDQNVPYYEIQQEKQKNSTNSALHDDINTDSKSVNVNHQKSIHVYETRKNMGSGGITGTKVKGKTVQEEVKASKKLDFCEEWLTYSVKVESTEKSYDSTSQDDINVNTEACNEDSQKSIPEAYLAARERAKEAKLKPLLESESSEETLRPYRKRKTLNRFDPLLRKVKRRQIKSTTTAPKSLERPVPQAPPSPPPSSSPLPPASHSLSAFERYLLTELKSINEKLTKLQQGQALINRNLRHHKIGQAPLPSLPQGLEFPMSTMEDVQGVEKSLTNKETYCDVLNYFSQIGGNTLSDCTVRILRQMMLDSLAISFNWKGQGGKTAFSEFLLSKVVVGAVRRNISAQGSTEKEIEGKIKGWLKSAKDRKNRRAKKQT